MTESKTFTEAEVGAILQRQMEQQAFMINLQTGLGIVFANGQKWGMTEQQMGAINRLYQVFMQPPQQPQAHPEGERAPAEDGPGTD